MEQSSKRLLSLDAFRGAIMFLLVAEAAGVHESIVNLSKWNIGTKLCPSVAASPVERFPF